MMEYDVGVRCCSPRQRAGGNRGDQGIIHPPPQFGQDYKQYLLLEKEHYLALPGPFDGPAI